MSARPLRILQVGTIDAGGGAAAVARALHHAYQSRGCASWQAVGQKLTDDPDVVAIPDDDRAAFRMIGYTAVQRQLRRLAGRFPGRGIGLMSRSLRRIAHPRAWRDQRRGIEDFEFPGSHRVLELAPAPPDVLHLHNLHGGYFDLRALASLSRRVPTILTLHDTWPLAGHCAYSLDCERWRTGCGSCPDLGLYPAVPRDATAENWRRKQQVYAGSRLYVAAPSQWLIDRVAASMMAPAVLDRRVIPHGIDLSVFRPTAKADVKAALGLPPDSRVVLLTAGSRGSVWKDRRTLSDAVVRIAASLHSMEITFLALEPEGLPLVPGRSQIRLMGYQRDPAALARLHQAADVYLHAARADTFPTMVLEALACGTAVVASRVGGIPEQVTPATGALVPGGDAEAMAAAAVDLLTHDDRRAACGAGAAADARRRFDQNRQADDYLAWYREILARWTPEPDRGVH